MDMYFIALVAPENINHQVLKWKLWMKENYDCEVALRSPAHITLIPPFWMKPDLEKDLMHTIDKFSDTENKILIQLKNFSYFKPKVIFVNVQVNDQLTALKNDLENLIVSENKFPVVKEERPFHPHITIATRDLYKKAFYDAWEYFKDKEYIEEWMANSVSLLRHNKKNWDVIATSQFKKFN